MTTSIWTNIGVSLVSGGLAVAITNYFITRWKDRNIAVLNTRVLPLLDNGKVSQEKVSCQVKFIMKRAYKPVSSIELFAKSYAGSELEFFCRPGLKPEKTEKGSVVINHVRPGDKIELVFLHSRMPTLNDSLAAAGVVDWSCPELMHVQNSTHMTWNSAIL